MQQARRPSKDGAAALSNPFIRGLLPTSGKGSSNFVSAGSGVPRGLLPVLRGSHRLFVPLEGLHPQVPAFVLQAEALSERGVLRLGRDLGDGLAGEEKVGALLGECALRGSDQADDVLDASWRDSVADPSADRAFGGRPFRSCCGAACMMSSMEGPRF